MEPHAVRRRLYALAFVDEFAPLYALFTLWFNDNSISTSDLSLAFVLWAALAVFLELPSGALADRVDRRALLAVAFGLRAAGIGIWLIWPNVAGLVVGAVLWAVHDAAASGAWEALIHDQLDAVGQASSYGVVIARVGQFSNIGLAAGTGAASWLLWVGFGIEPIGWSNVAAHAASIGLVLSLPDVRWVVARDRVGETARDRVGETARDRVGETARDRVGDTARDRVGDTARDRVGDTARDRVGSPTSGHTSDAPSAWAGWWRTLRAGVGTARHRPQIFRLTIVGGLIGGLFVVDEYVPLVARDRGASDAAIPLIVLGVWLGLILGGEVAARRPDLGSTTLATGLLGGTAIMAVAIAVDSPWALFAVGVGYAAVETTWVISDARFQAMVPSATRATVTSVRGLGEGVVAGLAFALIAFRSDGDDPTPGLHWVIGILALVSFLVWHWVPSRSAALGRSREA